MATEVKHEITVQHSRGFSMQDIYRAVCSCGKYSSRKFGSPGKAESAGTDHAKAMTGGSR